MKGIIFFLQSFFNEIKKRKSSLLKILEMLIFSIVLAFMLYGVGLYLFGFNLTALLALCLFSLLYLFILSRLDIHNIERIKVTIYLIALFNVVSVLAFVEINFLPIFFGFIYWFTKLIILISKLMGKKLRRDLIDKAESNKRFIASRPYGYIILDPLRAMILYLLLIPEVIEVFGPENLKEFGKSLKKAGKILYLLLMIAFIIQ